jgi:hypothetical protein
MSRPEITEHMVLQGLIQRTPSGHLEDCVDVADQTPGDTVEETSDPAGEKNDTTKAMTFPPPSTMTSLQTSLPSRTTALQMSTSAIQSPDVEIVYRYEGIAKRAIVINTGYDDFYKLAQQAGHPKTFKIVDTLYIEKHGLLSCSRCVHGWNVVTNDQTPQTVDAPVPSIEPNGFAALKTAVLGVTVHLLMDSWLVCAILSRTHVLYFCHSQRC